MPICRSRVFRDLPWLQHSGGAVSDGKERAACTHDGVGPQGVGQVQTRLFAAPPSGLGKDGIVGAIKDAEPSHKFGLVKAIKRVFTLQKVVSQPQLKPFAQPEAHSRIEQLRT